MKLVPSGVKVHIALGVTDMRKGLDGLAMLVQEVLKQDPFSGHFFCVPGPKGQPHQDRVLGREWPVPVHQSAGGRTLPLARRRRAGRHGGVDFRAAVDVDRGHRLARAGTDLAARGGGLSRAGLIEKNQVESTK